MPPPLTASSHWALRSAALVAWITGPKSRSANGFLGLAHRQRVAEADGLDDRQVGVEEGRKTAGAGPRTGGRPCSAAWAYSKPLRRCWARRCHCEKSQMPQVLRPSCSSMWRRPVSANETAARRPVGPPRRRRPRRADTVAADQGPRPSALRRRTAGSTGSPARRIRAWASVRVWKPPWLGVLATTRIARQEAAPARCGPGRSWGSSSWRCWTPVPAGGRAPGWCRSAAGVRSRPRTSATPVEAPVHVGAGQAARVFPISHTSRSGQQGRGARSWRRRRRSPWPRRSSRVDLRPRGMLDEGMGDRRYRFVVVHPGWTRDG